MNRTVSVQTKYIHWRDDLFYLAYLFLFLECMFSIYLYFWDSAVSAANRMGQICYLFFLGVCALSLFLRKSYTTKEILSIGGLLTLGVFSYFLCDSHVFFNLTLMISISKDIDFEKFLKRLIVTLTVFLFLVICLAELGILNSEIKPRVDNDQMRNSLGFGHPNTLGLFVFQLIAGVIVLERKNLKTIYLGLLFAFGLIFYWVSKSLTLLMCVCMLIGAVLFYKCLLCKILTLRQMKVIMCIGMLVALAMVLFVIYHYWEDPYSLPFKTLAGRIYYAQCYLDAYGLSAFGKAILTGHNVEIPGYSAGYFYLDNGEMWYLIRLGIVGFVVFFYSYIRMIVKSLQQGEFVICIVAAVYLFYTLTENSAMRIPFNFMIIYGGMMLYSGKISKYGIVEKRKAISGTYDVQP